MSCAVQVSPFVLFFFLLHRFLVCFLRCILSRYLCKDQTHLIPHISWFWFSSPFLIVCVYRRGLSAFLLLLFFFLVGLFLTFPLCVQKYPLRQWMNGKAHTLSQHIRRIHRTCTLSLETPKRRARARDLSYICTQRVYTHTHTRAEHSCMSTPQ